MNIKKIILFSSLFIATYSTAMNKEQLKETEARIAYLMKKSNKDLYRAQMFMQPPTITVHIDGQQLEQGYIDKEVQKRLIESFNAQQKYKYAMKNYEQKVQKNYD